MGVKEPGIKITKSETITYVFTTPEPHITPVACHQKHGG
jgi:hypothetical protein